MFLNSLQGTSNIPHINKVTKGVKRKKTLIHIQLRDDTVENFLQAHQEGNFSRNENEMV
ncbi:hypothetical protein Ocin01_10923 [Orchesella cincta]|uniref:Uncharacterized protein n=1 Tax=Orchesella cincta TaxID=48709 RepID=A0A1D2MRN5_ORCCI|nr:hypothetical protein Ocin01_10923 [Orchesella cincta]